MAEYNLGRVAFNNRGSYSNTQTYQKWDFVVTTDSTYLCISELPITGKSILNITYWRCIADGKPATLAAAAAQVAKENAETAANLANEKAGLANQATIRANTATENANTATTEANTATNKADISALNADEKAGLAVTAIQNANDKITEIDEVVIPNAETATQNAIDVKTDYEIVVKPDMIAKATYAQAQGDYAKAQGEAVEGTVSSINNNSLTIEEVTAQAIVAIQNRIIALEKILSEGLLDKIKIMNLDIIDNFNVWGQSNLILTGTSAPSVIPDFIGQTFINTVDKVAYTATGINSVSDWK